MLILSHYYLWLLRTIYNFADPALSAFRGAIWLIWVWMLANWLEIIRTYVETAWKSETVRAATSCISSYHKLSVDMDCICMGTGWGSEVCTCTASLPHIRKHLFHKLIHMVQIFMRKVFVVQQYPQIIFNYFWTMVYRLSQTHIYNYSV